jgi:hypothetical protein
MAEITIMPDEIIGHLGLWDLYLFALIAMHVPFGHLRFVWQSTPFATFVLLSMLVLA